MMTEHRNDSHNTEGDNTHSLSKKLNKKTTTKESIWELAKFTLIALIIVIPLRLFIAQPFVVSGESMVPTFHDGDYLIVDEISYNLGKPERGDVMIFRYPKQPDRFFIKRAIGLPGDTVTITDGITTIINEEYPQGFVLDDSYLDATTEGSVNVVLGEDEYFVMGDNREASSDSRAWGTLEREFLVGRAFIRLLPLKHIDILPGKVHLEEQQ